LPDIIEHVVAMR